MVLLRATYILKLELFTEHEINVGDRKGRTRKNEAVNISSRNRLYEHALKRELLKH